VTIDLARALATLIAGAGVFSSACGGAAVGDSTVYIDVQKIPVELRDEYNSFATNCSKCHSLSRALNAPVKEPNHWDLYVARMMRTAGSSISSREAPVILRFLHWYTLSYDQASAKPPVDEAASQAPSPTEAAPEPFPAVSAPPPPVPSLSRPNSAQPPAPAAGPTPPASEEAQDVTHTTAGEGR
jgi:hypothetical protein